MSALKKVLIRIMVVTGLFLAGFLAGCGVIYGAAADIEYGAHVTKEAIAPFHPGPVQK